MTREISADTAAKITQARMDFAKEHNVAVTVFILNPTGQIVHARANMVAGNVALQMRWAPLGVFPTSGGLPIMVDDQMIGAIGVGGSNMDEERAYDALTKVVGPQPALAPATPPAGRGGGAPTAVICRLEAPLVLFCGEG